LKEFKTIINGDRTSTSNKVLEWIFENTNELEKQKTEEQDIKSVFSVSVPGAGRFYEPFLRDLELIWRVDLNIGNVSK
jgi:hypothetical protein